MGNHEHKFPSRSILFCDSKSSKVVGRGVEITNENPTLYEIRTLSFDALLRELVPGRRFVLFNNASLVMVITRAIARNCYQRNLSVRLGIQIVKERQSKTK
jgi:hypothetical protein